MTDYDMSRYDEMKPSIIQYINLLAEFNKRLVNIKNNNIPIETRKKKAFELVLKEAVKLDGEELQRWKDKLENVFNPKKAEKVKNDLKVEADLTGYEIGEDVIYYTKYSIGDNEYKVDVKCMIKKINKCSITLAKYKCNMDFTDDKRALKEQTHGKIKFEWTDELRDKDNVVIKDVKQIVRSDDILYKDKIKATYYRVDYGM
tara:strand:+ start:256 stop:861 length:606 start_codon:yes stop_codon:yes gene_type:complete